VITLANVLQAVKAAAISSATSSPPCTQLPVVDKVSLYIKTVKCLQKQKETREENTYRPYLRKYPKRRTLKETNTKKREKIKVMTCM
jgi:hypothetical protein